MSSISGVSQSGTIQAQFAPQGLVKTAAANSAQPTALQEANETEDVTRQEAAKGDQVAIRKLARLHKAHPKAQTQPPQPALVTAQKGAAAGGLNVAA